MCAFHFAQSQFLLDAVRPQCIDVHIRSFERKCTHTPHGNVNILVSNVRVCCAQHNCIAWRRCQRPAAWRTRTRNEMRCDEMRCDAMRWNVNEMNDTCMYVCRSFVWRYIFAIYMFWYDIRRFVSVAQCQRSAAGHKIAHPSQSQQLSGHKDQPEHERNPRVIFVGQRCSLRSSLLFLTWHSMLFVGLDSGFVSVISVVWFQLLETKTALVDNQLLRMPAAGEAILYSSTCSRLWFTCYRIIRKRWRIRFTLVAQ